MPQQLLPTGIEIPPGRSYLIALPDIVLEDPE